MSRCFPFPPPGYEKKSRNDDIDSLTKEKHKEKKHKKEKRDKEKREGKEKREKEKSKDKHQDKKDRKEKHKDKKKDKDKDKADDERKIEGRNEGDKVCGNSQWPEELKDSKFMEELGKRIRDDKGVGNQMVEKITFPDQRRTEAIGRPLEKDIKKRIGGKEKNKEGDARSKDECRESDDGRATGNHVFHNLVGTDHKRSEVVVRTVEGVDRSMEKNAENKVQGKEKNKDKGMGTSAEELGTNKKRFGGMHRLLEKLVADQKRFQGMSKQAENMGADKKRFERIGPEKIGTDKKQFEGMRKPADKDTEKRVEGKEKNKEGGNGKRADKHRGKDQEEKRKVKDKDRDKGKEKEKEKVKEKGENKHKEQDKVKENRKEQLDNLTSKPTYTSKGSQNNAGTDGNLKKRKDVEMNGFLHESYTRPNKMAKPASSSHLYMENGRKLESCQIAIQCASDRQGMTDRKKMEINKECKDNGIIEALPPSVALSTRENGAASTRPPHPDAKYLSEILTVPKMEEWSDFDDQEWLFSSDSKPRAAVEDGETPQVWAEAVRIDSTNVCVLPYVIPY